jgi:hypothetical protein
MTKLEYLLVTLGEEAAEVVQACSKAVRFGLYDPTREKPARRLILEELADMLAVLDLLEEEGVFTPDEITDDMLDAAKARKLEKMQHSRERGILE